MRNTARVMWVSVLTIDTFHGARQGCSMPRTLRMEYPGAIYHVVNRGDRREDIYKDDLDRQQFLSTLEQACQKTEWQVHAYCLMRNHFHLVIETPQANLVAGMKWLLGVYTKRFNLRHKFCGHVFAGRYKALIVQGSGDGYLRSVCDYVHLNPARAQVLAPAENLEIYGWSSYPAYLKPAHERPKWLRVDRLLGEQGIPQDNAAGRQELAGQMEKRRLEETTSDYDSMRRNWCLGGEGFRQDLLAAAVERVGESHYGADRQQTGLVREEFQRLGWQEQHLPLLAKGDKSKVALARRLRQETTMSLKWIARRLHMGSWTYVSNLLHEK
jgi:putative transposase